MNEQNNVPEEISKGRFASGVVIFILGQATTLLIPFVSASGLTPETKTMVSGLLFFVTPQIGIVLSIAIFGKAGYQRLKNIIFTWLKRCSPPEVVSPVRYRIGLIMFVAPILWGWGEPYVNHLIPRYESNRLIFSAIGDIIFILSFFVLGGEFWDKVRSLFVYRAKA